MALIRYRPNLYTSDVETTLSQLLDSEFGSAPGSTINRGAINWGGVSGVGSGGAITIDNDAATITFNLGTSNWHSVTLGASRILALSNVQPNQQFTIVLIQGGSGSNTVTWFSTIKWAGGSPPTLTTSVGGIDVFTFKQVSSGNYYGFVAGQALA